ncbi:hypothetical protein VNO80_23172 [Phaseolus coccineus]|uniref:Uncharacterized protein n=1 Tax=Phaseolus coccineus TaxID=3886 RepID=A0AAN9MBZ2_PHACN
MGSSTISNPPLCSCGVTENPHPGTLPFRFRSKSSFTVTLFPITLHSPILFQLGFYFPSLLFITITTANKFHSQQKPLFNPDQDVLRTKRRINRHKHTRQKEIKAKNKKCASPDANFPSSKVNAEAIIIVQLKTRYSLYSEYVVLTKPFNSQYTKLMQT